MHTLTFTLSIYTEEIETQHSDEMLRIHSLHCLLHYSQVTLVLQVCLHESWIH
jgi:hypothetical protein